MEADEDRLIERIRTRAWDPARRAGMVGVPFSAVAACTDDPATALARANLERAMGIMPMNTWTVVDGGGLTALAYYRDAPHEPWKPPLPPSDVDDAGRLMGVKLPLLLRRVYTEVSDGGFGPAFGLPSLLDGEGEPAMVQMRPQSVAGTAFAALGVPLCDYGCGSWDWVSVDGSGYPVRRCEIGEDPDGEALALARTPGIPLATWFERWLGPE